LIRPTVIYRIAKSVRGVIVSHRLISLIMYLHSVKNLELRVIRAKDLNMYKIDGIDCHSPFDFESYLL